MRRQSPLARGRIVWDPRNTMKPQARHGIDGVSNSLKWDRTVEISGELPVQLSEPAAPRTAVGLERPVSTPRHPRICPAWPCPTGLRC